MSDDILKRGESVDLVARARAYDSVRVLLSRDRSHECGLAGVHEVVASVLAESGVDGLADVSMELALKLASAIERIAADHGHAAIDLVDEWFTD